MGLRKLAASESSERVGNACSKFLLGSQSAANLGAVGFSAIVKRYDTLKKITEEFINEDEFLISLSTGPKIGQGDCKVKDFATGWHLIREWGLSGTLTARDRNSGDTSLWFIRRGGMLASVSFILSNWAQRETTEKLEFFEIVELSPEALRSCVEHLETGRPFQSIRNENMTVRGSSQQLEIHLDFGSISDAERFLDSRESELIAFFAGKRARLAPLFSGANVGALEVWPEEIDKLYFVYNPSMKQLWKMRPADAIGIVKMMAGRISRPEWLSLSWPFLQYGSKEFWATNSVILRLDPPEWSILLQSESRSALEHATEDARACFEDA